MMIIYFLLMLMTACPDAPKSDIKAVDPKKDKTPEGALFSMDKEKPIALPTDKKVQPILNPEAKPHEIPPMMPASSLEHKGKKLRGNKKNTAAYKQGKKNNKKHGKPKSKKKLAKQGKNPKKKHQK